MPFFLGRWNLTVLLIRIPLGLRFSRFTAHCFLSFSFVFDVYTYVCMFICMCGCTPVFGCVWTCMHVEAGVWHWVTCFILRQVSPILELTNSGSHLCPTCTWGSSGDLNSSPSADSKWFSHWALSPTLHWVAFFFRLLRTIVWFSPCVDLIVPVLD